MRSERDLTLGIISVVVGMVTLAVQIVVLVSAGYHEGPLLPWGPFVVAAVAGIGAAVYADQNVPESHLAGEHQIEDPQADEES